MLAQLGVPYAPCFLSHSQLRERANNVRGSGDIHDFVLDIKSYRATTQAPNEPAISSVRVTAAVICNSLLSCVADGTLLLIR